MTTKEEILALAGECGIQNDYISEDQAVEAFYYAARKDLEQEVERLRKDRGIEHDTANAHIFEAAELRQQLAAAQAREQQLRKLIEHAPVSSGVCCCGDSMDRHPDPMVCGHSPVDQWDWAVLSLLKETQDTTALEAMIAKAGEVMRERSATVCDKRSTYYGRASAESQEAKDCAFNIRALPPVTLEDLK